MIVSEAEVAGRELLERFERYLPSDEVKTSFMRALADYHEACMVDAQIVFENATRDALKALEGVE